MNTDIPHGFQDYQSLLMHEEALRMIAADPSFVEQARAILTRWQEQTCARSHALLGKWQDIFEKNQWDMAVENSELGRQLRQASPLACLLPNAVRFGIIRKVRALKEAAKEIHAQG